MTTVEPPTTPTVGDEFAEKLRSSRTATQAVRDAAADYILDLETAMKVMITDRLNWQRGNDTL